jgi:hypothetical protein
VVAEPLVPVLPLGLLPKGDAIGAAGVGVWPNGDADGLLVL